MATLEELIDGTYSPAEVRKILIGSGIIPKEAPIGTASPGASPSVLTPSKAPSKVPEKKESAFKFTPERLLLGIQAVAGDRRQTEAAFSRIDQIRTNERDAILSEQAAEAQAKEFARKTKTQIMLESMKQAANPELDQVSREEAANMANKLAGNLSLDLGIVKAAAEASGGDLESAGKLLDIRERVTPESWDKYRQSGDENDLVPKPEVTKSSKPTVLKPQDIAIDADGNIIGENKNVKPRTSNAGITEQRRNAFHAKAEPRRAEIGDSERLSDRLELAMLQIDQEYHDGNSTRRTADRRKAELAKSARILVDADKQMENALSVLKTNEAAVTIGADVAQTIQTLGNNFKGLQALLVDIDDVDLDESAWGSRLDQLAGDNAELRTTLFNLAILSATEQGLINGRISNQQLELQMEQLAATARSPKKVRRKLKELRGRLADSLDTRLEFASRNYSALDQDAPDFTDPQDEAEAMSDEELLKEFENN